VWVLGVFSLHGQAHPHISQLPLSTGPSYS
jgi:hypothetical protein